MSYETLYSMYASQLAIKKRVKEEVEKKKAAEGEEKEEETGEGKGRKKLIAEEKEIREEVCQFYAGITAVAGLVTINTLAAISVDRYWAVVWRATPEQRLSKRVTGLVVISVWTYSVSWAACPILGWGSYVLDGIGTTCTFDYLTTTWWNRSFVISIAAGNFVLPFSLMVFCYTRIWAAVREVKRRLETDFPQATQGGGSFNSSNKERRPSVYSTGGYNINKEVCSGRLCNKTHRPSIISAESNSFSNKDVRFIYSSARSVCNNHLESRGRMNVTGISSPSDLCCEEANLIKYDENRNKSPSSPVPPNIPKTSSTHGDRRFSVYFRSRPEIVVALGRRRRNICGHFMSCEAIPNAERNSCCRSGCTCECGSRPTDRESKQKAHGKVCKFAFKSSRTMKDITGVQDGNALGSSHGYDCKHSHCWQKVRNCRYRLISKRSLCSFHSCCSTCCRPSRISSRRHSSFGDARETRLSESSKASGELSCSGEYRCGTISAGNGDRSRAKIKQRHHRLNCEHKTLRIILFLLLSFTMAWCPYLAVSLVGLFGDQSKISYLTSVLPSLVAKTSIVTNPILYSISHPKVRKRILTSILCPSHLSRPAYHVRMRTNQSSFGISNSQ
ncbi:melanopsin [Plakobranchus ocellatus]|uniref:Melanopsin n=1 Tax=Plakobranchus ocellatus TaxID=259542 RepID=A0AAV3Y5R1_9GAST|nr:melanopsin [Plakobranchus ocellatus]